MRHPHKKTIIDLEGDYIDPSHQSWMLERWGNPLPIEAPAPHLEPMPDYKPKSQPLNKTPQQTEYRQVKPVG